jgi:hypothetical protein
MKKQQEEEEKRKLESFVYLTAVDYDSFRDVGYLTLTSTSACGKGNEYDVEIKTSDKHLSNEFLYRLKALKGYRFKLTLEEMDWKDSG